MEKFSLSETAQWPRLRELAAEIRATSGSDLLDSRRAARYRLEECGIYLDYSRNLLSDAALDALLELAGQSPLAAHRDAMFQGAAINNTEQRPALHAALRANPAQLVADGLGDFAASLKFQQRDIRAISERIRAGAWLGATGKPVRDVINLGIGGSDLGPKLACEALKEFAHETIRCHFLANVDGEPLVSTLRELDPARTLVIVASKSFTTQETLLNANTVAQWFRERLELANPFASPHFIGITAAPDKALRSGIARERLVEFDESIGGRYSLWSAIGLPIAVSTGYANFARLLAGAHAMDEHFRRAPFASNMPVILALLGIWQRNLLGAESHAVIPYCERLGNLPGYLQQLDMESNGKSVTLAGEPVRHSTSPIVWGTTGTNGQHSFFQLLHQGTNRVPVDFIGVAEDSLSAAEHHRALLANMIAQSAALMRGSFSAQLSAWRHYPGNRSSNVLLLERLTPETLGALLALYEHKTFVQGCLWNINSFDQWGVELGKQLASELLEGQGEASNLDPGASLLLEWLRW